MKKITLLFFFAFGFLAFSQSKSTPVINLSSNISAQFTLNSNTNIVTLVLKGPSDRWFALGLGVQDGFGMSDGDVLVYTTSVSDRNFIGQGTPSSDSSQDWATVSNNVTSGVRTLTLERALTNLDSNDFQMPYATTNTIDLAWARSSSANTSITNHGGNNRGFASGTFTSLGVDDFSLNSTSVYPNPAKGEFYVQAKSKLTQLKLYNQTGSLIKTVDVKEDPIELKVNVSGIASGVYFVELVNDSEKSWKKLIIE